MIELKKNILQKSLNTMEENSYHNLCIMEKSVVNPFAYVYISDIDVSKIFNASYNKNAKYIYFTINDEKYIKFEVNINLNNRLDEIDRKNSVRSNTKYEINKKAEGKKAYTEYLTLSERGYMNRNTLELYVNGYKVPDKNILVTIYSGSIDLYVPARYIKIHENPSIEMVLNRYSDNNPYYNSYSNSISSNILRIKFLSDMEDLDKNGIRVYKNGILMNGWLYNEDSGTMDITSLDMNENDEIEFTYRRQTQYKYSDTPINKVITFDKNLLVDKPIFADIVETYLNGVRVFPKDVTNISPRNIAINDFKEGDIVTYYLVYDNDFPEEKNKYIDDLTRFFNYKHEDASIILNGEYEGYLPEYIKNINFPPEIIKVMNEDYHKTNTTLREFLEEKTKEYIAQNAESFKYLLRNLKDTNHDFFYSYEYVEEHTRMNTAQELADLEVQTFDQPRVVFSFDTDTTCNDDLFVVSVDGKVMNYEGHEMIFYFRNKVYLYLPRAMFGEDFDVVRIIHFPIYNNGHKHKSLTSDTIVINKNNGLGIIRNIDDLFIMRRFKDGYAADINITRTEDENNITITVNDYDPNEEYIVYNASCSKHVHHTVTADDIHGTLPLKLPYDITISNVYYPMASFYSPIIVRNGEILNKEIDYRILTQFNNPKRDKAEIIFGMICSEGDEIDIYYTEGYYESLGGVNYINSGYGVIYFENLIVPFDSGYLDLYVDGKLVDPSNIEVISTKMIRVHNVPNLINVGVTSKLNIPISILKDYTDTFINNPSLWDEYVRDYWYDYNRIDDFYLELNPEAEPVPSDPSQSEVKFDIMMDAVARFLTWGLIPRLIDCNVYYDFSNCHHMRELLIDKHDYIEINCNKEQLAEPMTIDMAEYMKSYDEVVNSVRKVCPHGVLDATVYIPDDSPLWRDIYTDELDQAMFNSV